MVDVMYDIEFAAEVVSKAGAFVAVAVRHTSPKRERRTERGFPSLALRANIPLLALRASVFGIVLMSAAAGLVRLAAAEQLTAPCRIEVVDKESRWPVPLVELRTTHQARFVTDNA